MLTILKSPEDRKFHLALQVIAVQQLICLSIYKSNIISHGVYILVVPGLAFIVLLSLGVGAYSAADDPVKMIAQSSFVDSEGKVNIVGTVRNTGTLPVQAVVGLEVHDESGIRMERQPTYGRIIWPLNDSPFKFVIKSGTAGNPFVADVKQIETPHNNMIILNYNSMAAGEERAFVGTVKNNAPFDIYNVSIFASARSDNATQLDTVRSNVISILKAGEEQPFIAIPNPAVKSRAYYYSCAGLEYDNPITTIDAGGKFIAYNLNAAAQVSEIRYENETDSIAFGIRPYSPIGGPVSFMVPQVSHNQIVSVMLDGKLHEASIRPNGKTINIDFFVPQGDHQVQIERVSNVPEMPFATLALAALTAAVLCATRLKTAFKIS